MEVPLIGLGGAKQQEQAQEQAQLQYLMNLKLQTATQVYAAMITKGSARLYPGAALSADQMAKASTDDTNMGRDVAMAHKAADELMKQSGVGVLNVTEQEDNGS